MPHYEIIYETGAHGVAFYEDEAEMKSALGAHYDRALNGQDGGPAGLAAERITKVLEYDVHPGTLNESQALSADEVKKGVEAAIKAATDSNGVIYIPDLAGAIRDLTNPIVLANATSRHDSQFKMEETKEIEASAWQ